MTTNFYYIKSESLEESILPQSLYFLYDTQELYYDDASEQRRLINKFYIFPTESFRLTTDSTDQNTLYIVAENSAIYIYDNTLGWISINKEKFYYFEIPYLGFFKINADHQPITLTIEKDDERIKHNSIIEWIPCKSFLDVIKYFEINCVCKEGNVTITLTCNDYDSIDQIYKYVNDENLIESSGRIIVHNGKPGLNSLNKAPTAFITWVNWDDTVLHTDKYIVGEEIPSPKRYEVDTNTLLPTDKNNYVFDGWNINRDEQGNITYKLRYIEVEEHTVTWIDKDEVYHTETYLSNERPPVSISIDAPEDYKDNSYNYEFKEWEYSSNENGNITYTSVYDISKRVLTATWLDYKNEVCHTKQYLAENVPDPDLPQFSKGYFIPRDNDKFIYRQTGWNTTTVDDGVEFTPIYAEIEIKDAYLQFINIDGTVLQKVTFKTSRGIPSETVYPGDVPNYPYEEKPNIKHRFDGWGYLETLVDDNGDVYYQYTAKYLEGEVYPVIWLHADRKTVLAESSYISYNRPPEANSYTGELPTLEDTDLYRYVFSRWDRLYDDDSFDVVKYIARFDVINKNVNFCYCTWKNIDGTTLHSMMQSQIDTIIDASEYPYNNPTYENDESGYKYFFKDWEMTISSEGNIIYTAVYYTVPLLAAIWMIDDEIMFKKYFLKDGMIPDPVNDYEGKRPIKKDDEIYSYKFIKWEASEDEKSNITYKALYNATPREYTITWINDDRITILHQVTCLGTDERPEATDFVFDVSVVKPDTDEYTYEFDHWETTESNGNITHRAIFKEIKK